MDIPSPWRRGLPSMPSVRAVLSFRPFKRSSSAASLPKTSLCTKAHSMKQRPSPLFKRTRLRQPSMSISEFQVEVRRRRTVFFLWWIPGIALIHPLRALFNLLPRELFTFEPGAVIALLSWFGVWLCLGHRLTGISCPFCGNRAFGPRPFFSTRRLNCAACGKALFP